LDSFPDFSDGRLWQRLWPILLVTLLSFVILTQHQSVAAAKEMDLTVILPYLTAPASVSHSLIRNQMNAATSNRFEFGHFLYETHCTASGFIPWQKRARKVH